MLTFIVETIYPVDAGTFVVPSQEEEILRVLDLVGKEKANGLHRLLPSVHVVAEKEVVGFWWEGAVFKEPQEVRILAMYVT